MAVISNDVEPDTIDVTKSDLALLVYSTDIFLFFNYLLINIIFVLNYRIVYNQNMSNRLEEFSWGSNVHTWSNNPYTWSDCQLIAELVKGGGGIEEVNHWKKNDKEKYEQIIKLWCKVKEYDNTFYMKKKKKIKLEAEDIQFMITEVSRSIMSIMNIK